MAKDDAEGMKAADTRVDNRSGVAPDPLEPDRGPGARSRGWSPAAGRDDADRRNSPNDRSGDLGPIPASGPRDIGADELQPLTSGDAANVGAGGGREPTRRPGGGTLRGTAGDAGADAGDGALDATDTTTVT